MTEIESIKTNSEILKINYNNKGLYIIYPFTFLIILTFLFLVFGTKEVFLEVPSIVNTHNDDIEVFSDTKGIISSIEFKDGDYVRAGEEVIFIDQVNGDTSKIIASGDGYLQLEESISEGVAIDNNDLIFSIFDLEISNFYIQGFVTADKISEITEGQSANFLINKGVNNNTIIVNSEVDKVGKIPSISDEGAVYLIEVQLNSKNEDLVLGMSGNLNIILDEVSYIKYLWNKYF